MHQLRGLSVTCALLLGLSGCASSSLDMAPPSPDRPWQPSVDETGEIVAGRTEDTSTSRSYVLPSNSKLAEVPPPAAAIDKSHAYSLAELIDLAEAHNPSTRIAWLEARNAALAAGIARSAYLPDISASVVGGYQSAHHSDSALGFKASNGETAKGSISAISLRWLLFDFGKRDAVVEAVDQVSVISNIAFTAAHQEVIYKVSLAFYAYAAARTHFGIAQQALRNSEDVEAAANARFKHGIGTVVEQAQAHQAVAQAQLDAIAAEGLSQDAYSALLSSMGISPLSEMKIAELSGVALSAGLDQPIERYVAAALARRPDMLSANAAQRASLAKLRAAQAEFLPKLFVSTTGSYSEGGLDVSTIPGIAQSPPAVNLAGNKLGATVFLGLHIPIHDGGTRSAMLEQAHNDVEKSRAAMSQIRDEATRQIVSAGNKARTSLAALDAARSLVVAARTTYDAAFAAYKNGVGSITAVTMAQNQLLRARFSESDASSNAFTAAATLALASGVLGASP